MRINEEIKKDFKSIGYVFVVLWSIFLGYRGIVYYVEHKYVDSVTDYYLFVENNWKDIERAILSSSTEDELNQLMLGVNFYIYVQDNYLTKSEARDIKEFAHWQKEEFIKDPRFGYHELFENAKGFESYRDEMRRIMYRRI